MDSLRVHELNAYSLCPYIGFIYDTHVVAIDLARVIRLESMSQRWDLVTCNANNLVPRDLVRGL